MKKGNAAHELRSLDGFFAESNKKKGGATHWIDDICSYSNHAT